MSASSIATETSIRPSTAAEQIQDGANVLMHPTPSIGAVPSVAGLHSGPVPGNMPLWTPPETPLSMPGAGTESFPRTTAAGTTVEPPRRTHSASSSVSGIIGPGSGFAVRRDSDVSERPDITEGVVGTKREGEDVEQAKKKRRRIAPTQINALVESPAESAAGSMDPPSVPPSAEP